MSVSTILLILSFISTALFAIIFQTLSSKIVASDIKEIKNDSVTTNFSKDEENVIDLMLKNVSELHEYYIISKNQATRAFILATINSILGIVIYILGILSVIFFNIDISIISVIGGTVSQIIAALSFSLYNKTIKYIPQKININRKVFNSNIIN